MLGAIVRRLSRVCDKLHSVRSVAEMLDVSRRSVYRYIESGELTVVDMRTGVERSRVRIPGREVEALIERRMALSKTTKSAL
ncbi:helix-turn-helix domain-containing protein [Streptomyces sp. ATCC 21386]|uniref:helix-turn-helix domain-containing protein n=1 Tax=Streptomyces sp. ATCC 21386 TaxID=2699428 RepID=UPI00255CCD09|nr:helix-turn-helix domain-containing protein [Streptomyces sp. ATCC 21386]